jgi:hypothetical protein
MHFHPYALPCLGYVMPYLAYDLPCLCLAYALPYLTLLYK